MVCLTALLPPGTRSLQAVTCLRYKSIRFSLLQIDAGSLDRRCRDGGFLAASLVGQIDDLLEHEFSGSGAQLIDVRRSKSGRGDWVKDCQIRQYHPCDRTYTMSWSALCLPLHGMLPDLKTKDLGCSTWL